MNLQPGTPFLYNGKPAVFLGFSEAAEPEDAPPDADDWYPEDDPDEDYDRDRLDNGYDRL